MELLDLSKINSESSSINIYLGTGVYSPLILYSLTIQLPSIRAKSQGIIKFGSIITISPGTNSFELISMVCPNLRTLTVYYIFTMSLLQI